MKKLLISLLLALLILLQTVNISASGPIYNSENEAITVESQRLRESGAQPGTYPVTIQYRVGDKTLTKTINVIIVDDPPVIVGNIGIQAQPVNILSNQVARLSAQEWITLAQAHAWNTQTYESIPITIVDTSHVKAEQGIYTVQFGVNDETSISINATVIPVPEIESIANIVVGTPNYEHYYNDIPESFVPFEATGYTILKISVIAMLFLPLIFLFFQYVWTSKAMRDVSDVLAKNKKK